MEYTPLARTALKLAQEIANGLKPDQNIDTDDLLAGIAAQQTSDPARYLRDDCGATIARITQTLREIANEDGFAPKRGGRPSGVPNYTAAAKEALEAAETAAAARQAQVGLEHILFGVLANPTGNRAFVLLSRLNVNTDTLRKKLVEFMDQKRSPAGGLAPVGKTPTLTEFCENLTQRAAEGKLDPVIGRQDEIEQTIRILSRRNKPNAVLIGEPGVGKTAIAEGIAQRIVAGDVPELLLNAQIFSVDIGKLTAGTRYRGDFEERVKKLVAEAIANPGVVLVLDELHAWVGAGGAEGAVDASSILKPVLSRGELHCIGATTLEEYRKVEKDKALNRRFVPVMVNEPSYGDSLKILYGLRPGLEKHHRLTISDAALEAAVRLSARYITDRFLPDKAIDLVDEAGSGLHLAPGSEETPEMTAEHIAEAIQRRTGIPVAKLTESQSEKLLNLAEILEQRIKGQNEAVEAVVGAFQDSGAGINDPKRPIASFILTGPTGVGKTALTKAVAATIFDDEEAIVRIDMSEYMEKHNVSRLIGAPPGYVGFDQGGQLTEAVRRRPFTVVLFDEIEKAHPDVFNTLLQVIDDGILTDSQGRTVDFKNTVIMMTSNIGSRAILSGGSGLGLVKGNKEQQTEDSYQATVEAVNAGLKSHFRPEFLNRVDRIVVFRPLQKDVLKEIIEILVADFSSHLQSTKGLTLEVSNNVKEKILTEGYNPDYGARPLKRALTDLLRKSLRKPILSGQFKSGDHLIADIGTDGEVVFTSAV